MLFWILQVFKKEIEGKGVCVDFVLLVSRPSIKTDAKKAADIIQASSARVILIFCWYTDVLEIFQQLAERNVSLSHFSL